MFKSFLCFLAVLIGQASQGVAQSAENTQGDPTQDKKKEAAQVEGPSTTITVEERLREIPTENTTATKLAIPIQKTPSNVGVVARPVIESQHAVILRDAIKNVSGVYSTTNFGVHDFFTIRGFDSLSSGLVLTDGAIEPQATFYRMYNLDRIEVLKGPSSFLYGGRSLAGAVNLVRKVPEFRNFLELDVSFGRFQDYQGSVDVNWADPGGRVAMRLNGLYQHVQGYRDNKDHFIGAVNPALTWRMTDSSSLTLNFEFVENSHEPDSGIPLFNNAIPNVDRTNDYQAPSDISRQTIQRFRADYHVRLNDTVTFQNKFYFTGLDWQSDGSLFVGAFPNARGSVDVFRVQSRLDDSQRFVGNQAEFLWSFNTGGVRHELLTGFESARLGDEYTLDVGALLPIDLFNPVNFTDGPIFDIPQQAQAADARILVFAPYFLDRIIVSDQVDVFVGTRLDVLDYEDTINDIDRTDTQVSPMASIVYSPAKSVSIYAGGGKAFAPQSTFVTSERQPEESTQFEAGVKNRFLDGRVQTTVSFYHLQKENIAIVDDNGITQQTGDQRSRGVEFELATEFIPDWYSFVSYSYNDPELTEFREVLPFGPGPFDFLVVDRSGNDPAFAPRNLFSCWTMKQFTNGIGVGIGARFVGERFIAEDNVFSLDSYITVDASVSYSRRHWTFGLNLKNLTDTEYETRGFGSQSVTPASPIGIFGSVRYSFGF